MGIRLSVAVGLVVGAAGWASAELPSGIVSPYLKAHAALAHDSVEGVADAARQIAVEARKLGDVGAELASAADNLAAASELAAAREAFGPLSDAVIAHGRAHGFGTSMSP